ncbi:MAG: Do family serine endopeptidase [Gammaproteobacteria bacterium]|nr:Do family serine endopeptidase [Gammaproteobacteria bacterium]MBT3488942.1 Do family serine endopeptidase [Gammaproteobacteria bacterium]MBT3719387.1 Do family serine endopeptidase [Gammaproteobacteria bacterium]MBT3844566.1 Do family serine endopeptidase [Gammaproteobacteria bacterium]MBT3893765.1 Do family serine endopeptidase [Gammaproteobacteria bacterium]
MGLVGLLWMVSLSSSSASGQGLPNFTELVKQQMPAVVSLSVTQRREMGGSKHSPFSQGPDGLPYEELPELFRRFFEDRGLGLGPNGPTEPPQFESQAQGSGSILTEDGYILTNHHVVENADEIMVRLYDHREFRAEVVGSDARSDIALIKIDAVDLPTIKTGTSKDLEVGEWVLAIGSPFGFEMSATAGIVSAKARNISEGDNKFNYVPFIQTDVAINPGNSGGPLFNLEGEVVGVNSIIFSKSGGYMGLSFAIPVEVAMDVVKQVKNGGHVTRGWLGVMIQPVTRDLAESFGMDRPVGALVAQILDESPAANSNLQVGDVIVEFNGHFVESNTHLPPIVGRTPVGHPVPVKVMREGRQVVVKVVIGELPGEDQLAEVRPDPLNSEKAEPLAVQRLGMHMSEVPKAIRKERTLGSGGVYLEQVESGSVADRFGLRRGDVISRVNYVVVEGVEHFLQLIERMPKHKGVPVYVVREKGPIFLAMRLP